MAMITTRRGSTAEPLLDQNTDYGGGLESQRRRQIADAYRKYSGGQGPTEDVFQQYLRDPYYETGISAMFKPQPAQQPQHGGQAGTVGIFTDPGAQQWEQATNAAAGQLMTPQANPDFQPYVDYMRNYFKQLQQPGYTPAQQDLIQTQALDPLERQRQAARQQVQQRFAQQGVQGGLVERAMQDVDRQFNEMRTKSQAGFATHQIGMDQQRQQQAAQVGAALSQAQQAAATNDEGRMMQALALLFQIPQYADTRLGLANSVTQPMNPTALLGALGQINASNQGQNQFNAQQNSQYWSQLGTVLGLLFGG